MKDGGSAFPKFELDSGAGGCIGGMSMRDYAVIKFLAAQIAWEGMEGTDAAFNVKMANEYFDAMLAEREKK